MKTVVTTNIIIAANFSAKSKSFAPANVLSHKSKAT